MMTKKMKTSFAFGALLTAVIGGGLYLSSPKAPASIDVSAAELASHPFYLDLKTHVESLAAIDKLCRDKDSSTCYCELAESIRDEHDAINRLLVEDPSLRGFVISVRQPASTALKYDLNKLPQIPDETKCLSAVAAPTLLDHDPEI